MATHDFRRKLTRQENLQVVGAAAAAALGIATVIVYLGRIWLQRTPIRVEPREAGETRED